MTLGIDVGKHRHNITLLDAAGHKVFHNVFITNDGDGIAKLLQLLSDAQLSPCGILVGMEATGHYWMNFYAHLVEQGFAGVEVLNPIVIHARKNDHVRGAKTDRVDALQIARYLREADHSKSALAEGIARQLRGLARLRFDLNNAATREKGRLLSLLDLVFPEYTDQFADVFGRASLNVLAEYPSAEAVARVDVRRLSSLLQRASRGRLGREKADQLKAAARNSFSLLGDGLSLTLEVKFTVERLNQLIDQIDELQRQIETLMEQQQEILMSIPGIGAVWAPLILGEILPFFHPDEKDGANTLVACAGLDAVASMTGKEYDKPGKKTRMSKRGSRYLRTALMQAAHYAATGAKDPMFAQIYQRQRDKGKHHLVAVSHVARKMAHVIFAVLRDEREYQPVL